MKHIKNKINSLAEPFRSGNGLDKGVLLVFLIVNGLVFVNACLHDPRIGYDAGGHLKYIQTLSELRLPTPEDTNEFFSPPLPYLVPALIISLTGIKLFWAAKIAQFINLFLSIGLTYYLLKICKLIAPQSSTKLVSLIFITILPVYYKTFAFVRGEPYVIFFTVFILYFLCLILIKNEFKLKNIVLLGLAIGSCFLSRQWGFLLLPPIVVLFIFQWVQIPIRRQSLTKAFCVCFVLITITSGWFYVSLYSRYGSFTAFNRAPVSEFSFNNQPPEFYFGLSLNELFEKPIRPSFTNQFFPVMYSDIWGDYWCYFSVFGRDKRTSQFIESKRLYHLMLKDTTPDWLETNYSSMQAYLGRVNLISLFPTALVLISLIAITAGISSKWSLRQLLVNRKSLYVFQIIAIVTTILGYLWFLIKYPNLGKGDTIKATYISQIIPFVAILVGTFSSYINKRSRLLFHLILGGLFIVFFHNILSVITSYSPY